MSLIEALILGIVQGVTEFLPISSSAHLHFARWCLGVVGSPSFQYFDLACHAGTMCAAALYLRKQIVEVLTSLQKFSSIFLALLPLIPVYLMLKPFRHVLAHPQYMGYGLLGTSAILFFASKLQDRGAEVRDSRWKWQDMLCIGMMQALALMPGLSRSGSSMAAARFRGWSWKDAATFSFLLAVPCVLGGEILETMKLMKMPTEHLSILPASCYAVGFMSAFGVGLVMVRFIFRMYERFNAAFFALYCALAGCIALGLFHA